MYSSECYRRKKKTLGQKCIKNHFIYAPFSIIGELLLQTSPPCLSGYGYTIISSAWNKTTMQFPKCSSQLVFVPNLVLMFHVLSRWGNRSSWEAHREKKKNKEGGSVEFTTQVNSEHTDFSTASSGRKTEHYFWQEPVLMLYLSSCITIDFNDGDAEQQRQVIWEGQTTSF